MRLTTHTVPVRRLLTYADFARADAHARAFLFVMSPPNEMSE